MLTVADLMTTAVQTISSSATVAEAIELMQVYGLRSLIVERPQVDMHYGIVTEQDIVFKVVARDLEASRVIVQDIMRQPCIGISPQLTVKEAAAVFADAGLQRAPVVGGEQLLGVISLTDILMKGIAEPETRPMAFSAR